MHAEERSLTDYLEDIRQIRETMLMAEKRLHVPAWFFFAMGALLAVGSTVHAVVAAVWSPPWPTILLAVWLPVFLLAGVAEAAAWVVRGRREGLPWMSPSTGRFFATVGGIMVTVVAMAIAALLSGWSPAGVVLMVAACLFLAYAPYSPGASIWIGWSLLAPGLGLMIARVSSPGLLMGAAAIVVLAFVLAGVVEARNRPRHG